MTIRQQERDVTGQECVEALIRELADCHFYGSLTLKFEAGKVVILKKEETLKPHDLSGQPKDANHGKRWE